MEPNTGKQDNKTSFLDCTRKGQESLPFMKGSRHAFEPGRQSSLEGLCGDSKLSVSCGVCPACWLGSSHQ
eukprot:910295-Pelagomonas_calceolata.AAC.4